MDKRTCCWLVLLATCACGCAAKAGAPPDHDAKLVLKEGWFIQSSSKVPANGAAISTEQFQPKGWYRASVPTTVLNALVENKVYPDPYYGMNLRSIPGTSYPIGGEFAILPMPADSPFKAPWWYRREFELPADYQGKTVWLHFDGINFRANIWLNGQRVADSSEVVGPFRFYEFDISKLAKPGAANVVAVEVFPPGPNDLGINWVDVNPTPPDKNLGLWQGVYITTSGPVALRFPQVTTKVDLPSLAAAHLTVRAWLHNASERVVRGVLSVELEGFHLDQPVEVAPHTWKPVKFSPDRFAVLNVSHPRLWWPWQMGPQNLYEMKLAFHIQDQLSDHAQVRFGIREVTSELTPEGHRVFSVNGQKMLVRGAGWWSDMLLRSSPERQEAEMRYARDMNLNVLRMDGKFEDDHFLDLADRYGMLLMPGWCCCDHWEKWENWKDEDYKISVESLRDRIRWLRNHPSVLAWLNGDDNPPPERVAQMYVRALKEENWPNPYLASATEKPAPVTGPTGVKMTGPYEYVPPVYWLADHKHGGAFGLITETSPGPAIPPIESLRELIPAEHLWPIDEYWDYHAGGGAFKNIRVYTRALNARYGEATGVEDFAKKAQVMDYEGQRAMYEAYGRNKYVATGVLQEMLNGAWPSVIWVLYDYYLRPGGGYFGTKKGCEPLHVQYSYDDRSVWVVNSYYQAFPGVKINVQVYNLDLKEKYSHETSLDVASDSAKHVLTIPEIPDLTTTYFVRLTLEEAPGKKASSNWYWLSTKPDVLDWEKTEWFDTPTKSFADLTGLATLPQAKLQGMATTVTEGKTTTTHVTVENRGESLAFFIHLRLTQDGKEVLPILWEDNYFELMPGEKREIAGAYAATTASGAAPVVEVDGWNVERTLLPAGGQN